MKKETKKRKMKKSPIFLIALLNFLIIILVSIYIIYLRFVPYETIKYDGYAVSGKELLNNLLNTSFDVDQSLDALEVKDQDEIYQNLKSFYLGANKEKNINLNYPIYINDNLALYNLSSDTVLITSDLQMIEGYSGSTLTSGALYNSDTMTRADYHDYILMRNSDGMYINTKEIEFHTSLKKYKIKMNSIINFADNFITYYTLENGKFFYGKILDADMSSKIKIEDFNREYTYKEFLIGLDIIGEDNNDKQEEENKIEENIVQEEKKEKKKENKIEENKISEQQDENNTNDNIVDDNTTDDNNTDDKPEKVKWQKPTVSCTDFVPNVYTATNEISISDPSGVINKALTFSFYTNGEIQFRVSAISPGEFKVRGLLPNTKYQVIGTFQYINESGGIIEVKFFDQEFKTLSTKNIKTIELDLKNGQVYPDKIELKNLKITSSLTDEAIFGVSKAEIIINGVSHSIGSNTLRSLLQGNVIETIQFTGIESNTKCKYEIIFYDTAGNKMKLKNNTGNTVTSKAEPSVRITVKNQNITSLNLEISLTNPDEIELSNYRYIIYSSTGEQYKKSNLSVEKINTIHLDDFDPNVSYNIRVYADYDIEDGNGLIKNRELANERFTTEPLWKLGYLNLNIMCDKDNDITYKEIKFSTKIKSTTDNRLIDILRNVKIQIQNQNKSIIDEQIITNINDLDSYDGIESIFNNLNSNTEYKINISAIARQGSVEEEIKTTYNLTSFITLKKPVELYKKNIVVTNDLIDFDVRLFDKDNACINKSFVVEVRDDKQKLIDKRNISTNTEDFVECKFEELNKDIQYTVKFFVEEYNETRENKKTQRYTVEELKYTTSGLEGNIDLLGLIRKNNEDNLNGANLIDVESENNWYSKCFDVIETKYEDDSDSNRIFTINSKRNYGKSYNSSTNTLILTPNQCYVYDFSEYKGQTVTMSFESTVNTNVFIQEGKEIGEETIEIRNVEETANIYHYTTTIPNDGYLGFYLNENSPEVQIKNLKVELGSEATDYSSYNYNLFADIKTDFISENFITYNPEIEENKFNKYYIRIIKNNEYNLEDDKEYPLGEELEDKNKSYQLEETESDTEYEIQLLIKLNVSEQKIREYVLSSVKFNYHPTDCKEIKSISSKKEFLDIQPNGNYILLKDISLTNPTNKSGYTFGNPNISFNGSIDFNGKKITKDVYTESRRNTSYMFYKLSERAEIKNIVLDFYIDNQNNETIFEINEKDGIYSLFLYNEGNINNLFFKLKECPNEGDMRYIGLVGYSNKGTIEKFIINTEKTLTGSQYLAGCALYTEGIIQNGYIYGNGIKAMHIITPAEDSSRFVGGLVYKAKNNSIIQNIYNLSKITINHRPNSLSYAANIVYSLDEEAKLQNVYSTQEFNTNSEEYVDSKKLIDYNNKEVEIGPNVIEELGTAINSYYFTEASYEYNSYNTKQDKTLLSDYNFQNNLLNSNNYNEFITTEMTEGYYPHLKLNNCMPRQDKIQIYDGNSEGDDSQSNNVIDIMSAKVLNNDEISDIEEIQEELEDYDLNDENIKLAFFDVYNPNGKLITDIKIDYLKTKILKHQPYNNKRTKVYAVLFDPIACMYEYEYNIYSVTGEEAFGSTTVYFGEGKDYGNRTIKATFVKFINNESDWDKIDEETTIDGESGQESLSVSGLIQNYRLLNDLDFENSEYLPSILGEFTGRLEGNSHIISNIQTSDCLFESASGLIQNLMINTFKLNTTKDIIGLIGQSNGAKINNVHVKDIEITSSSTNESYIGGICGNASSITIENCSVNNITLDLANNGSKYIGGIAGIANGKISNCFVQAFDFDLKSKNLQSFGGLLGYSTGGIDIKYCYTQGSVITDKPYVGGIFGSITSTSSVVKYCYSFVNITDTMTSGKEWIGGIGGCYGDRTNTNIVTSNISNNLYLGNTYVSTLSPSTSNVIVGNITQANSASQKNYGYKNQIINGAKITSSSSMFLDIDTIFTENTYTNSAKLNFGQNYIYEYKDEDNSKIKFLPKLAYSNNNEIKLPNQNDMTIIEGLKVISISYSKNDDDELATIKIKLENKNEQAEFTGLDIDNMKDINLKSSNYSSDTSTVIFTAKPEKYYDTYKLNKIFYKITETGIEGELDYPLKIATPFYKKISNFEEWRDNIDTSSAENYMLTGNIFFGNQTINENVTNKSIGRLENSGDFKISGKVSDTDTENTISTCNEPLIKEIKTIIKNIDFENITVNNTGLIYRDYAPINNCNFNNITINATGKDRVGVVSRLESGSTVNNITLNKIKCSGRNYVGGLAGYRSSSGNITNITGTYLNVKATGNHVGGILGYAGGGGTIKNIKAYQYQETGKNDEDESTDYLAKGAERVGGCIGWAAATINNINADKTNNEMVTKFSKISGTSQVGGCIGRMDWYNNANITSTDNEIVGTSTYVGGCIGLASGTSKNFLSQNNSKIQGTNNVGGCMGYGNGTKTNIKSLENELIKGTDSVGGCIGWASSTMNNITSEQNTQIEGRTHVGGTIGYYNGGTITTIKSKNNLNIQGANNVGGCVGTSYGRILNAKTDYDSKSTTPNIIANNGNYVGGIVGQENYNVSSTAIGYYSIVGAYVKNANISGKGFIGGIGGYSKGTVYATAVDNTEIKATGDNAGGILGYYKASTDSVNSKKNKDAAFYVRHSFCQNSKVIATNNAGGIIGKFVYGDIQYCYVGNTLVQASSYNAGGLVGYLDNSQMDRTQYFYKMRFNFIANEPNSMNKVIAVDGVGGLIGTINKTLRYTETESEYEYLIRNNLIVTDISSNGDNISMGIGKNQETGSIGRNQCDNIKNIYVYEGSFINQGASSLKFINNDPEKNAYNVLSSDELKLENTFTDSSILNFKDTTGRFKFEEGYFPRLNILTANATQTYWSESYLNVTQNKIAIPDSDDSSQPSSPSSSSSNLPIMSISNIEEELPDFNTYAVDADKFNIEFSELSEYTYFDIKTLDGEVIIERMPVTERVYTFEYDFNTPLEITISNLKNWYTQEINRQNTQNILSVANDEYLYLSGNMLKSSKKEFDDEYVNIYNDKALTQKGDVYNVSTKEILKKNVSGVKLLEKQIPITENNYNGIKIQTFYHCSKVIQDEKYSYRDQQLFIKNDTLYIADGNLDSIGNSIIIDSYNEKQYETILGTDGIMYDLLTKIKYPDNFKNENIIAMTNNIDNNDDIVLVYYSSGKVYGFNYITGKEVYNNNVQEPKESLISYFVKNLSSKNLQYTPKKSDYTLAQELTDKLESVSIDKAIIEINGENTNNNTEIKMNEIAEDNLTNNSNTLIIQNNNSNKQNEYITTYNPNTKSYVVYSTSELFNADVQHVQSENEKINNNPDLVSYYSNISISKTKLKDIGMMIITVILASICVILIIMYKKENLKRIRKK